MKCNNLILAQILNAIATEIDSLKQVTIATIIIIVIINSITIIIIINQVTITITITITIIIIIVIAIIIGTRKLSRHRPLEGQC